MIILLGVAYIPIIYRMPNQPYSALNFQYNRRTPSPSSPVHKLLLPVELFGVFVSFEFFAFFRQGEGSLQLMKYIFVYPLFV